MMPARHLLAAIVTVATAASVVGGGVAHAQIRSWKKLPDERGEFVRLCAPHLIGRWAHPEAVCVCLHDHAIATVSDPDLHEALLRGITERGVPAIENDWIPSSKLGMVSATFTQIAKPTLQCMFGPATE
jgi:hypothetical protein